MSATWIQRKLWDYAVGATLFAFVALAWGWISGELWVDLVKWLGAALAAMLGLPATAAAVTTAVAKARGQG